MVGEEVAINFEKISNRKERMYLRISRLTINGRGMVSRVGLSFVYFDHLKTRMINLLLTTNEKLPTFLKVDHSTNLHIIPAIEPIIY